MTKTKTVEAIYDSGVLKPLEVLPLADQQRVRLTVETLDGAAPPADQSGALRQLIERLTRSSLSYGGPLPTREELHERGERV